MTVCFPGVGLHRSRTWPGPWAAPAERTEAPPGGPYQYYAVHQYSIVRRVWGAGGVAGFLIFAPPTPPQDLIAGILSTHVRCILSAAMVPINSYIFYLRHVSQLSLPSHGPQCNIFNQAGRAGAAA